MTSPATLARPYLTLPSLIPRESPSTSEIFGASENLIDLPPAIAEAVATFARGLWFTYIFVVDVSLAEFASVAAKLVWLVAQTVSQEVVRAGFTVSVI